MDAVKALEKEPEAKNGDCFGQGPDNPGAAKEAGKPCQFPKNVHEGHRERLKQRFLRDGLRGFETHQILELLLFFGIPRRDTNEIAHALLDAFGNLPGVLKASYEDLIKIKGMTSGAAVLIRLSGSLIREYNDGELPKDMILDSPEKIGAFILPKFFGEQNERVLVVCTRRKSASEKCWNRRLSAMRQRWCSLIIIPAGSLCPARRIRPAHGRSHRFFMWPAYSWWIILWWLRTITFPCAARPPWRRCSGPVILLSSGSGKLQRMKNSEETGMKKYNGNQTGR